MASTSTNAGNNTYFPLRAASLFNTTDTGGIEGPRNKLVSWALEPKKRLEVMFVVGMAGLGKTTLVHKVCERVHNNFDRHAWITAFQSKTAREILQILLVEKFTCSHTISLIPNILNPDSELVIMPFLRVSNFKAPKKMSTALKSLQTLSLFSLKSANCCNNITIHSSEIALSLWSIIHTKSIHGNPPSNLPSSSGTLSFYFS